MVHRGWVRTFVAGGVLDGEEGRELMFAGARELFRSCHLVVCGFDNLVVAAA
jgi:hypothetical protein